MRIQLLLPGTLKKTNPDFFAILRTLIWLLAISEFSEKWRFVAFFIFFYLVFVFLFYIPNLFSTLQKNSLTFLAFTRTPTLRTPTLTSLALCKNKLNFSANLQ